MLVLPQWGFRDLDESNLTLQEKAAFKRPGQKFLYESVTRLELLFIKLQRC